jgi:hypothetical protein
MSWNEATRAVEELNMAEGRMMAYGGVMSDLRSSVNADPRMDIYSSEFMKKGGQAAPQSQSYSPARDRKERAKPINFRYTNKLANRLGVNPFKRPSPEHIKKYIGRGVYWENRKDKSDISPAKKFDDGGEYAYGGSPRISNASSREYTENQLPFRANNLDGKVLDNGDYVVLSYGYYPIWYWSKTKEKWYGNSTKYSITTSRHMSQSRPVYDAEMLPRDKMDALVLYSHERHIKEWGGELEVPEFQ